MSQYANDVCDAIVDEIVTKVESGDLPPWVKDWTGVVGPCNAVSERQYTGFNPFYLMLVAEKSGFAQNRWMTANQAIKIGKEHGRVDFKGEKATRVPHFRPILKEKGGETHCVGFQTTIWKLFNVAQIKGLPKHIAEGTPREPLSEEARVAQAEAFFKAIGADLSHGGARAFYTPSEDRIQMPPYEAFKRAGSYYSTLAHEHVHWTGHKSRLARDLKGGFGSDNYAKEELTAEIGAAFVCGALQIPGKLQHPEYVQHWLKVIKGDRRAIFTAASKASKALALLTKLGGLTQE